MMAARSGVKEALPRTLRISGESAKIFPPESPAAKTGKGNHMKRESMLVAAVVAMLMATGTAAVAATAREKCLANMDQLFNDGRWRDPEFLKKHDLPGGAHMDSDLLLLKTDTRFMCQKEDLDEAIAVAYAQVCPGFELCDKMKILVDKKLSVEQKRCVEKVMDGIVDTPNELKKRMWDAYKISAEGYVALIALGDKCPAR
jgi:hypothetical protein